MDSRHLFVFALSLFVGSATLVCVPTDSPESRTTPESGKAAPEATVVAQGSGMTRLFNENCAKCHGENGEGGGGGTQSLISVDKFDQKNDRPFFDAIKKGVPDMGMDAYGQTLTDPEIWGLVVHIREIQARELREKSGSPKPDASGVFRSKRHSFKLETVAEEGLKTPWAIDWLPDGKALVTNRPGTVVVLDKGRISEIEGIPASVEIGQGGMMEVAVHPDYAKNGWIYLAFTDPAPSGGRGGMTKVVRGKLTVGATPRWTTDKTIFAADPSTYNSSGVHFGSRIVFDGKGHLFFAIGERGNGRLAQDLTKPNGKVYRVNDDGSIPADNPFASAEDRAKGYLPAIWSYGHRNPQGLAFDLDGKLWDTEHAPRGGDEVNEVVKAANYGWPIISFGINYSDAPHAVPWPTPEQNFKMPVFRWLPSTGACGLDLIRGTAFPEWNGDLVAGGLSGQNVDRLRIKDGKLVEREELLHGMGRVRDTAVGPDGTVYVIFNQPDKIVRLVPAK